MHGDDAMKTKVVDLLSLKMQIFGENVQTV